MKAISFDTADLERLNRGSLSKSFVPQADIAWDDATTDDEYEALYGVWSLFVGTGRDADLSRDARIRFAKYQQMNLMQITALLERHGLSGVAKLYDLAPGQDVTDYIGHFLKEEIYHYSMFTRAIAKIHGTMNDAPVLPSRLMDRSLRWMFRAINLVPFVSLRMCMLFTVFRFAEQVTMYAHDMVRKTLPRREGLVAQVWARHALDEARHLKFDDMVLERLRPRGMFKRLPERLVFPACLLASLLIHLNELWAARAVGIKVSLWHLPSLVRKTQAPFKQRIFGLVERIWHGKPESNPA